MMLNGSAQTYMTPIALNMIQGMVNIALPTNAATRMSSSLTPRRGRIDPQLNVAMFEIIKNATSVSHGPTTYGARKSSTPVSTQR